MFKELDPLLHSQLRLAVMSFLVDARKADFLELKEKTQATAGNLSVQIQKLKDAGYILVRKTSRNNYPSTVCEITSAGSKAFQSYVSAMKTYLK
ncbi:MAG: transcriptional regulator [Chryseobacterium sp.]|nr:MAG: transcriptional regulator [Chryseobacterium sp.]